MGLLSAEAHNSHTRCTSCTHFCKYTQVAYTYFMQARTVLTRVQISVPINTLFQIPVPQDLQTTLALGSRSRASSLSSWPSPCCLTLYILLTQLALEGWSNPRFNSQSSTSTGARDAVGQGHGSGAGWARAMRTATQSIETRKRLHGRLSSLKINYTCFWIHLLH